MFVLGSITLVLEVVVGFQEFQRVRPGLTLTDVSVTVLPSFPINVVIGTFSRLMVRLHELPYRLFRLADGYSVYSKRYYLCLARRGSLEQRQTRHRRSSFLYPRDHRYIKMGSLIIVIRCSSGTNTRSCRRG